MPYLFAVNEIKKYLCYESNLNDFSFINQIGWALQDGFLKPNLFYAD